MFEKIKKPELNALKSEHLKDAPQVLACVGTKMEDFLTGDENKDKAFLEMFENAENVDFFEKVDKIRTKGHLTAGYETYVISLANENDKRSDKLRNCTSVIISGTDKDTGKNISLVSHQDPKSFLPNEKGISKQFTEHLQQQLSDFKIRCLPETIDAVMLGGNYLRDGIHRKDYAKSVAFLSNKIKLVLGFEPVVITGPKTNEATDEDENKESGDDKFLFDTKNRRLYLVRPEVGNSTTESYLPSDFDEQAQKWEKELREKT